MELSDPARSADEATTLVEMLDYYRAVLWRKADGLDDAQLAQTLPPSDLNLAGLLMHLSFVEDWWFDHQFAGRDEREPWASMPWDDDPDWELHHATDYSGAELRAIYRDAVERSRVTIAEPVSAPNGLDQTSVRVRESDGQPWNLRWILVHMIEEYARHCGHADFIRQSIDGATGD